MLLAIEGGGFFSSSASGYSKELTFLLLGEKQEEKSMRVTPWSEYQLVEQETNPDLQLASGKHRPFRGCASFVCFGRAAPGPENPTPLKVGPFHNQEVSQEPLDFDDSEEDQVHSVDIQVDVDDDSTKRIISRKSSLKRSVSIAATAGENPNMHEELCEKDGVVTRQLERRKVQWTDTTGGDLFEIREFEMSDASDDEFNHGAMKTCSCSIM